MRRYLIALSILFFSLAGMSQTTTYVGTLKDLTGAVVTSGRITWTLNAPSGAVIPGFGAFSATTVSCLINATGNPVSSSDGVSPCVITNNSSLSPTGTSYKICLQPYSVTPGSCFTTFANGGTADVSTLVPTPATMPNYGFPAGGPPGPANALSIGTVNAGTAAATITGTAPAQILNLTLPPGAQGPTGAAGPTGPTGPQGAAGVSSGGAISSGSQGMVAIYPTPGTALTGIFATGQGSPIAPSTAVQFKVPSMTLASGTWTSMDAHGDSVTFGSLAAHCANSPLSGQTCWADLVGAFLGFTSINNFGVGGTVACEITREVFVDENPGASSTVFQTYEGGINDWRQKAVTTNVGGYSANTRDCARAAFIQLTVPSTFKTSGGAQTPATNWSVDNTLTANPAIQSTTNGAVQTIPYTTIATGQNVCILYRVIDANTGVASIVDNAVSGSGTSYIQGYTGVPIAGANGGTDSVSVSCLTAPSRAIGSHLMTVTVLSPTSATGIVSIVSVVVMPTTAASMNPLWVMGVPRAQNDSSANFTSEYNEIIKGAVQWGQQMLMPINFCEPRNYLFSTSSEMGDNIHPNDTGHAELAACIEGATGQVSPNLQASLATVAPSLGRTGPTGGTDTISPTDTIVTYTTTTVITLPVLPKVNGNTAFPVSEQEVSIVTFNNPVTVQIAATGQTLSGVPTSPGTWIIGTSCVAVFHNYFQSGWHFKSASPNCFPFTYFYTVQGSAATVNMTCNQDAYFNSHPGAAFVFPTTCHVGKSFFIKNFGPGTATFVGNGGDSSAFVLGVLQSCTFTSLTQSAWYVGCSVGQLNIAQGTPTYAAATGCSAPVAHTGYTNTNTRGQVDIACTTATTGVIGTIDFSAALSGAPFCSITEMGGTSYHALSHSVPTTALFTVSAGVTVASQTITLDYDCQP